MWLDDWLERQRRRRVFGTFELREHLSELPQKFDQIIQSWDTANKDSELANFSVCTTWGLKDDRLYLLNVFRRKLNFPQLKRSVREDMQRHFQVSPPSVHQMIVTLERNRLIRRQPGVARSIQILVAPEDLPILNWLNINQS